MRAGREFDKSVGLPFKTFAARGIRDHQLLAVHENRAIINFLPERISNLQAIIVEARKNFAAENDDRQPTKKELSALTGISEYMITRIGSKLGRAFDQSESVPPEDTNIAMEKISDLLSYTRFLQQLHLDLDIALSRIPARDAEMIRLHLELGLTFEEIGEKFGLTRQRIQQIVQKSCNVLMSQLSNYFSEESS